MKESDLYSTTLGLQRVQVGEEVVEILLREVATHGRHDAVAANDGGADAIVVGGRAGGQVLLFEDAAQRRTVEWLADAVGVALAAGLLKEGVTAGLLRVELIERRGRRKLLAAEERRKRKASEKGRCSKMPHKGIVALGPVRVGGEIATKVADGGMLRVCGAGIDFERKRRDCMGKNE